MTLRKRNSAPNTWNNLLSELNWLNVTILTVFPFFGLVGAYHTKLRRETAVISVFYYWPRFVFLSIHFLALELTHCTSGITADYHRMWAHRSYNAGKFLQYFLAIAGAGAVEGSIKWWLRSHRAHHRYTDTELDLYNAGEGFCYLSKNEVVQWQHKHYIALILLMGFIFTFCVNSLAHWLGDSPFNDKHSPRDLITWFIWVCQQLGLATHLKVFPNNEVRKGQLTMQLKRLRETQEKLTWPLDSNDLPVISWDSYLEQASKRPLILVSGFIHDVSSFVDEHPGGAHRIIKYIGKDATTVFFGGIYDHSNAAHNVRQVGQVRGGAQRCMPPSRR
ncbi:delta 9-fatty acid desaturase protein [Mycena rebaudengoi]|nr:delta 9-fatty acid desaturase protein [Mycena rebaudengoi]